MIGSGGLVVRLRQTALSLGWSAALSVAVSVSGASISGKITLKGDPPPERFLPLGTLCKKIQASTRPATRTWVVDENGGLADVIVYLKTGVEGRNFKTPSEPEVLQQEQCQFVPQVMAAQVGQEVHLLNTDPLLHSVLVDAEDLANRREARAQLPKGKPLKYVFEKPALGIEFKGAIHKWMSAHVAVFPHPFFAVSTKDGGYTITEVPPGEYTVGIHHRTGARQEQVVKVGADNLVGIDFTLKAPQ